MPRLDRLFVRPAAYMLLVAVIVGAIIVGIGETLLRLHGSEEIDHTNVVAAFVRPELITAFVLALAILAVCAFLARSDVAGGVLDPQVVVGRRDFWSPEPPRVTADDLTRRGPLGSVADIKEGFTLYAQNGALGRVVSLLPGETEYGRRRRGLIFASGLYGANEAMWIPVEAVTSVYPETGAVFLAAKGDEVEHFGWNRPPESFRRDAPPHELPKSF